MIRILLFINYFLQLNYVLLIFLNRLSMLSLIFLKLFIFKLIVKLNLLFRFL